MSSEFHWDEAEGDIAVPEQAAIAVYLNGKGDICIRQAGQYGPDEDQWVVVTPGNAAKLAKAILDAAGPIARPDIDWAAVNRDFDAFEARDPESKDRTAAERQRRYRQRHRNAQDTVTRNAPDRDVTDGAPMLIAAE